MEYLPKCRKSDGKPSSMPYWNDEIKVLKEEALEAFWIYEMTGKPTSGPIFDDMRFSKRRYHYAIRDLKRNEDNLRNQRMAESLAAGRNTDMWKCFKKTANRPKKPSNVDGISGDIDIVNLFASKNCDLYNSVPSDDYNLYHCM